MKLLIVNNFRKNKSRRQKDFDDFVKAIKKSAVRDKGLLGTEIEFYVVNTIKELSYYIMDRDSERYHSDESGRTFDRINAVFINGDCNYVPWHDRNNEIYILIKMCV